MRGMVLTGLLALFASSAGAQTMEERFALCAACHGSETAADLDNVPLLGGQPADYLMVQLYLYRENLRHFDIMNAVTAGMTDDMLRALSDRVAGLPAPVPAGDALTDDEAARARDLVAKYRCDFCHSGNLAGHDQIPRLAGQREGYLAQTLRDYKTNARAGYEPQMNEVAQEVKDADIPVLAKYISRLR